RERRAQRLGRRRPSSHRRRRPTSRIATTSPSGGVPLWQGRLGKRTAWAYPGLPSKSTRGRPQGDEMKQLQRAIGLRLALALTGLSVPSLKREEGQTFVEYALI